MASDKGMAKTSTRTLWKGAITFGLVHIPVGLHSATEESDVDFDWLDRRTMDPVGYKRINKRTGREIDRKDVVKGVAHGKGSYVVLSPQEIAEAYPRTTQAIEIETFVDADDIPFVYLEKPYYAAPIERGEKVYALLREALKATGKAGIARVVIHGKQHLAVLKPFGPALVVNLLRWGSEVRSCKDLPLPAGGKAGVKDAELKMARHLIEEMSGDWDAAKFRDEFHDAVMKLVAKKAKAGDAEAVAPLEETEEPRGAEVVDLTELLRRSLRGGDQPAPSAARKSAARESAAHKPAARKPAARKASARKPAARAPAKKAARGARRAA